MNTWAIVPVKPFRYSKSRLAGVLPPDERVSLSQGFLTHTLDIVTRVPRVAQVLVVSRDPAVLDLARMAGALAIPEAGAPDLNLALEQATQTALAGGAEAVLILPTDLPCVTVDDVKALVTPDVPGNEVAIAPDRHMAGTNALHMRPPGLLSYRFGPGSFGRHLDLAEQAGIAVRVCSSPGLSLDVDEPEDLALYRAGQVVQ